MFEHLRARDSSYSRQDVPRLIKTFVLVVVPCVLFTTETGIGKERGRRRGEGGRMGRVKRERKEGRGARIW